LKKALVLILAIGLAVALLAITGCGSDSTTIQTPEGEVTFEEDGGSITFEGDEGSATISDEQPSEAELGVAVYPGAEYIAGSGMTMSGGDAEGGGTVVTASFTTNDSYDDVVAWYNDEIGEEAFELTAEDIQEATWVLGEDEMDSVSVSVAVEDGEVVILIYRMTEEF
jgi:hypothetical protein